MEVDFYFETRFEEGMVRWRVEARQDVGSEDYVFVRKCIAVSTNVWTAITDCLYQMKEAGWL